ncbi:MAG: AraC family transcriptional regulator [Pseudomonadota bacterium]
MGNTDTGQRVATTMRQALHSVGYDVDFLRVSGDADLYLFSGARDRGVGVFRRQDYISVNLCIAGRGELSMETERSRLRTDIRPGMMGLTLNAAGEAAWPGIRHLTLGFTPERLAGIFRAAGLDAPSPGEIADRASEAFGDPLIATLLKELARSADAELDGPLTYHAMALIAHRLFGPKPVTDRGDARLPPRIHALSGRELKRIEAYIEANIANRTSVEELAVLVGLSKHHFSRRFLQTTGLTPYRFVLDRKMSRAALLLRSGDGDTTITDVALSVGYDVPSHFTRAFSAWSGMPPRAWQAKGEE